MISINSSFFINSLLEASSVLKTQIKNASTVLSQLSSITNTRCAAPLSFQNQNHSTIQSMKSPYPQYTDPSSQIASDSDEKQSPTGIRQAPQPPLGLVEKLTPLLKEFQLRPERVAVIKSTDIHPAEPQQAPLPPQPSGVIVELEQVIKDDKQSLVGAAGYTRSGAGTSLKTTPPIPPAPPLALFEEFKNKQSYSDNSAPRPHHNSAGSSPTSIHRTTPAPSLSLIAELEQRFKNKQSSADEAAPRPHNNSVGIRPATIHSVPPAPSLSLIAELEQRFKNKQSSADEAAPRPHNNSVGISPATTRQVPPAPSLALFEEFKNKQSHSDNPASRPHIGAGIRPARIHSVPPAPSLSLIAELEQRFKNKSLFSADTESRPDNASKGISPKNRYQTPLPPLSEAKTPKLGQTIKNDALSARETEWHPGKTITDKKRAEPEKSQISPQQAMIAELKMALKSIKSKSDNTQGQ